MDTTLTGASVPRSTCWCTFRSQEERYLVYNQRTDEMHLIPPEGFYVYGLCDGRRTVDEILEELVFQTSADPAALRLRLHEFLAALVTRGILEEAGHVS